MAKKSAAARDADSSTKADLLAQARKKDIPGRSKMTKGELAQALHA